MDHFCGYCQQRVHAVSYCGCGHLGSTLPLYGSNMGLGVDAVSGDLVENLGNGLGVDLETGDLELEIAPGLDIDLGDIF